MMAQLTAKLMAHPLAAKITVPVSSEPVALAELYSRLITHADYQSHCVALAIEFHLRNLVVVRFNVPEHLEALNIIETALDSRDSKRGRGKKRENVHNRILAAGAPS